MDNWYTILQDSITTIEELKKHLGYDCPELSGVIDHYPMGINRYVTELIRRHGDPIGKQFIPDIREIQDTACIADPLGEERLCAAPNLVHKYPDRVLLLVTGTCAAYCRFCTRKRKVGTERMQIAGAPLGPALAYIREHKEIREVLISGGDPLLLDDEALAEILSAIKAIPTIEIIRIGSRAPSTLPMRITPRLVSVLKRFHPLFINVHFNHPAELTPESQTACRMLADAGIPLGCQTVLLKGINDNPYILQELFRTLLRARVRPYYLFQGDLTRGTDHFRTSSRTGIAIMRQLYGNISGMAIPTLALDAPGGKGKIPLTPNYILSCGDTLTFMNFRGEVCSYPEPCEPG